MAIGSRIALGVLLAMVWLLPVSPAAADGEIDPAFGDDGERLIERTHSSHTTNEFVGGFATLPDGRLYWSMAAGNGGVWLGRLLGNGDWDTAFGDNGLVEVTQCVPALSRPSALAADADGGVVLWTGACLLRFDATGKPDATFAVQASLPGTAFFASVLRRDHEGRWLLAGNQDQGIQVRRYLPDGGDDPGFGDGGLLRPPRPEGAQTHVRALVEQADGRLLLAGWSFLMPKTRLLVSRWLADGKPDTGFGGNDDGSVLIQPPAGFSSITAEALAVDRDGSLVIAGNGNNGSQSCCALVTRLAADGSLDPQFGLRLMQPPGIAVLSPFGETAQALTLLPGRQILVARNSFPLPSAAFNTRTRFTLIRLHADGDLDTDFGQAGWKTYVVSDPTGAGMTGPYSQLHGMHYEGAGATMFGRTFFEDGNSNGRDFVTFVRARFERLFDGDFEP